MLVVFAFVAMLGSVAIGWWWAAGAFPWVAAHGRKARFAAIAFVVAQPVASWMVIHRHGAFWEVVLTTLALAAVTLGLAAGPLVLLRLLAWWTTRPGSRVPASTSASELVTRREAVERIGGLALLGASAGTLGWGAVWGRHMFQVCEVPVRIRGLPAALDGYVIAQISDIHAGVHVDARMIDEGLNHVRRCRPDLVVVTGDLVDLDASFAPMLARKLADLPARDGVSAILGNHDYYAGAEQVASALTAGGVDILVNRGKLVRPGDGGGFALLGVDDRWATRYRRLGPDLGLALATVPASAPRILLSHQPPTIHDWAGSVALQLSGHTHGGQINPGIRPAAFFYDYIAGAYEVEGTTLYVNRGFGTAGPPSRIGTPPEITRLVLVKA